MKFEHNPQCLTITAKTVREALRIAEHYKLLTPVIADTPVSPEDLPQFEARLGERIAQMTATLDAVKSGCLSHDATATEKRPWFAANVDLGPDAVAPYLALLTRVTGYTGEVPLLDLPYKGGGLLHTHIVERFQVGSEGVRVTGFIQAEDWNGQPAATRAAANFHEYVVETIGFRRHEPEYLVAGNNVRVPNPKYLHRHAPEHGLGSPLLWQGLFTWWRLTVANDAQRAALDRVDATAKANRLDPDWAIRESGAAQCSLVGTNGLHLAYTETGGMLTWAEFQAL